MIIKGPYIKFRLFGTKHCKKCRSIHPNDIFAPFRSSKCQCGEEINERDGIFSYIEEIIKQDIYIEAFIGDKYSIDLTLPCGSIVEIPLKKTNVLKEIKYIQKVYGFLSQDNPDMSVITNFDRDNLYVGLLRKNEQTIVSSEDFFQATVTILTDPTFESHIPTWEVSFQQAIFLALKNEYSLAIVLFHTTVEIFLSAVINIGLTEQGCLKPQFREKLLDKVRFDTIRQKILLQLCSDDYNPSHHSWRNFGEYVTKPRKSIVHYHETTITSQELLKAALATFDLIYYILESLGEKYIEIFKQKWNRSTYPESIIRNV